MIREMMTLAIALVMIGLLWGCHGCGSATSPVSTPTADSTPAHGASSPPPLELIVLGSGGPGPDGRASTCFVLLLDGTPRILVDAGSGSFARLGEANLALDHLDMILLTHLHVDHTAELPGIVKARAISADRPILFHVIGPGGAGPFPSTSRFIDLLFGHQGGAFAYLADFSEPVTFAVVDVDATPPPGAQVQTMWKENDLRIDALAGHHDDAPAILYRVTYKGRSATFSGDIDAAGLQNLRLLADDCHVLVVDTVVLDPPTSPAILYTLHTPPRQIGEIAAAAHAGALLLTHLNRSIDQNRPAVLESIRRNYKGPVTFARDLMHVTP